MSVEAMPLSSSNPDRPGITLEMTREAARRAGITPQFEFIPWRRAQEQVANGRDLLITPLARTPEREDRYRWIALLYRVERTLASLDKPVDSLAQAQAEKRTILVGAGTAQEQLLHSAGYPPELILSAKVGEREIDLLVSGRAQAWLNSSPETIWRWQQAKRPEPLLLGRPIQSDDVYLACSRDCSAPMIESFSQAIREMRSDGSMDRLLLRYEGGY
ncbi:transporter substrate-binding domain-containing protein [Niveispirillum sp. SYP-B3756]|uniref:substrate-binding periplasmic protein n=1 Tax=Niveispirillum sp. SYP-B3756 TaxID=2662178 RepID=UPI0015649383|nr:transporter substrate-binding domain-containing protein [Niveispirillum sp. SYP-B3756]